MVLWLGGIFWRQKIEEGNEKFDGFLLILNGFVSLRWRGFPFLPFFFFIFLCGRKLKLNCVEKKVIYVNETNRSRAVGGFWNHIKKSLIFKAFRSNLIMISIFIIVQYFMIVIVCVLYNCTYRTLLLFFRNYLENVPRMK